MARLLLLPVFATVLPIVPICMRQYRRVVGDLSNKGGEAENNECAKPPKASEVARQYRKIVGKWS